MTAGAANSSSLRSLARSYAAGRLSDEAYRSQRRALLNGIEAGRLPLAQPAPPQPAAAPGPDDDPDDMVETVEVRPPLATQGAGKSASRWPALLAAVLLLAGAGAAALWWLQRPGDELSAPLPEMPAPEVSAPPSLLNRFLERNRWDESALTGLAADWRNESLEARLELVDSDAYRRFEEALHERLLEEQAMAGIADARGSMQRQQTLIETGQTLGLDAARLAQAARTREQQRAAAALASTGETAADAAAAETDGDPDPEPEITSTELPAATPPGAPAATGGAAAVAAATIALPAAGALAAADPEADNIPAADAEAPLPPAPAAGAASDRPGRSTAAAAAGVSAPAATQRGAVDAADASAAAAATPARPATRRDSCRAELAASRRPYCRDRLADGGSGPRLAVLAAGSFTMGGARASELPQRTVTLARGLAISIHETSVAEYRAFCAATGRSCSAALAADDDLPVVNVTWHDARAYADWLSSATGQRYRLPSEAEWEFAARGGTTTRYPFGDEILPTHARFSYGGSVESPLPRRDKTINRNGYRLYHMVGNVREWTLDAWSDTHAGASADGTPRTAGGDGRYTVRGGSYAEGPDGVRSASRTGLAADTADPLTGFRVVRELR